jgi:catechol 2,3-dioxygenase-like lactoylglutathione lyase family enzyme
MWGEWLDRAVNLKNAEINSIELTLPGYDEGYPYLEIFSYSDITLRESWSSNTTGYSHLSFEVEDVDLIYNKAILNGAQKYGELTKKEFKSGTLTFVYIKDPDGNIIEIENWTEK